MATNEKKELPHKRRLLRVMGMGRCLLLRTFPRKKSGRPLKMELRFRMEMGNVSL